MRLWTLGLAAALGCLGLPHAALADAAMPRFVEETAEAGISSVYAGEWESMVGGGATSFDCDSDGFPDLLLAGGSGPASFYRNVSARAGALRFEAKASGLELDNVSGAYPFDIDGDGNIDVLLLRVGENIVMRGQGECRFERANEAWSFDGGDAWSTAASATFEHGAAWPTIAIGNYIDRRKGALPWGSCTDNWLHRPDVANPKSFGPPIALTPSYCALSILFTDWNRSGVPSLRVSNDREYYKGGQEQLWRVDPGQPPALYKDTEGWKFLRIWGMGIASYDLDFDDYPEYFLTSMADNKLQKLAPAPEGTKPQPTYADVAFAKGVTAHRPYTGGELKPSTAWHAQFEDVNNDGLADLFVAKGNVAEMPDFAAKDPNNLLLQVGEGKFKEVGDAAGVASLKTARGAILADFNLDGLMDLVVVNRWESAQVWRNVTPNAGGWIALQLRQSGPNRDAIGSWIEVRRGDIVMRREITVGGGHAGGQMGWWHFGIGGSAKTEARLIWPDGATGPWQDVESGRFYIVERDKPATVWTPR